MIDLRDNLPRAAWAIGRRTGAPTGATLHYNGPPVAGFGDSARELAQLAADARYHMRPDTLRADGIQYHYAVLSNGTACQLRDDTAILWHCANIHGNTNHLAIHLPLGGAQTPTDRQWAALGGLLDSFIVRYGWSGRSVVVGHREWPRSDGKPQKSCPGPIVFRMLQVWRGGLTPLQPKRYRVLVPVALIREGPGQQFKVALHGTAKLHAGDILVADSITVGTPPTGSSNPNWIHTADGVGFVHQSLVTPL